MPHMFLSLCACIVATCLLSHPAPAQAAAQKFTWYARFLPHDVPPPPLTFAYRYEEATRWGFTSLLNEVSSLPLQPSNAIPAWINGKTPFAQPL